MNGDNTAPGGSAVPRYPMLDQLRGSCVIVVIVYHCLLSTPTTSGRPVDNFIESFVPLMTGALDLFFIISGFLITLILDNTRNADRPIGTFYIRRALRIIPLYYGFLLFAALFLQYLGPAATGKPGSTIWEWAFLTNFVMGFRSPTAVGALYPHFWSLAVEEHFYLVWPWVVILLAPRRLLRVCAAVAVLSFAGRIVMGMEGLAYTSWLFTPTRLDGLAIGALIALLHKYHSAVLQRWAPRAFAVALVATFPVFFWLSDIFFTSHPKRLLELAAVMGPFLFSLLFGSLVATLVSDNHKRRPTGEGRLLLTTVARYSYGMYAFHVPIMVILFHTGRVQQTLAIHGYDFPYRAIYSMVILGLSYVAGFLSWELYEKKVLQHAPRYRYSAPVLIPPPERLQALPVQ